MKIKLSPQVSDRFLKYKFENEKITVNNDITIDLSTMPNGIMTESEYEFLLSAKRENGILFVELLNPISELENREEILFPTWQEV